MIKRTLYFGNPAYLSTENHQMVITRPSGPKVTAPIEDIGLVILDCSQITISQPLLIRLIEHNVGFITCDATHHPIGLMLNLDGHTLQSQRFKAQVAATAPLKKQLWQQTVKAKIKNQAGVLAQNPAANASYLLSMADKVKSGDTSNMEAQAAIYYWRSLFIDTPIIHFNRDRGGMAPNPVLNYGYAILRAIVARALVGSGLMPTLGIFHRNQYNAYCLADDIMEPYRPYVDLLVYDLLEEGYALDDVGASVKKRLLEIPVLDVQIDGMNSPLMNAVSRTTSSLVKCFEKTTRKILFPEIIT